MAFLFLVVANYFATAVSTAAAAVATVESAASVAAASVAAASVAAASVAAASVVSAVLEPQATNVRAEIATKAKNNFFILFVFDFG
jgi:hypothetical protein